MLNVMSVSKIQIERCFLYYLPFFLEVQTKDGSGCIVVVVGSMVFVASPFQRDQILG